MNAREAAKGSDIVFIGAWDVGSAGGGNLWGAHGGHVAIPSVLILAPVLRLIASSIVCKITPPPAVVCGLQIE